ncbi:flagellar basal body-associated FliL family protein [Desulfolucanica intricata]|uniref:flagellar basal body-associated FliL family protein n=1 Tax=Desulfolucanica intricata TaxID=1285191 RepID=UPI00083194B8|nr:flagellar basal body-associated FliL family protein [Desulfolucanica intricata]
MAKENKDGEKTERKPKRGKLIIQILAVIVLLLAGAAAAYFIVSEEVSIPFLNRAAEEPEKINYSLEGIVVNLSEPGHYLRVTPVLEYYKDEKLNKEIEDKKPQIIDEIIIILRNKSTKELMQEDSVESIKAELLSAINKYLTAGKVNRLYFVEFLIQ